MSEWVAVARSDALPDGEMLAVHVGQRSVALYRVEGSVYATDNVCTHGQAILTDGWLDGNVIECPLHGGSFDVCTGKGLGPPVDEDLGSYPVIEREGEILVEGPT